MSDKARFEIVGFLDRLKVPASGKCAFLTVRCVDEQGRKALHELVTFDLDVISGVQQGNRVTVRGRLASTKLRDTKRTAQDGTQYDVWAPQLIAEAISQADQAKVPAQRQAPQKRAPEPAAADDDIPF
jgi:hypothetical protein